MRTRVKFCGLVRCEDADTAVALGVDAIGLVFYPRSPRFIDLETAAQLRRRLPSWVAAVGLFVNESVPAIKSVADRIGLDVVQLHGDESAALAQTLSLRWWKALRIVESGADLDAAASATGVVAGTRAALAIALDAFAEAEYVLLDSARPGYGGSGHRFDWSVVPAGHRHRLILSGGLDAGNVGEAIADIGPFAVDTSSAIQGETPREKDVVRMERFMAAVMKADQRRMDPTE